MISFGIGLVLGLAAGFGAGRVKNAQKLKAVKDSLDSIEAKASQEVKSVVAYLRSHF